MSALYFFGKFLDWEGRVSSEYPQEQVIHNEQSCLFSQETRVRTLERYGLGLTCVVTALLCMLSEQDGFLSLVDTKACRDEEGGEGEEEGGEGRKKEEGFSYRETFWKQRRPPFLSMFGLWHLCGVGFIMYDVRISPLVRVPTIGRDVQELVVPRIQPPPTTLLLCCCIENQLHVTMFNIATQSHSFRPKKKHHMHSHNKDLSIHSSDSV